MQMLPTTMALVPNLLISDALGVVAAVVISFILITLIASYYRFQHIIEEAEETNPEEMGTTPLEVLRVQMARYIAGCARRNTSFSFSLIRVKDPSVKIAVGSPVFSSIRKIVRHDDLLCIFDDQTAALFTEAEPEDSEGILTRVLEGIAKDNALSADLLCAGISSYPGHGLAGKVLIETATTALDSTTSENPVFMPEIEDPDAEEEEDEDLLADSLPEEEEEHSSEKRHWGRRRESILDPLTGVLKPKVVSPYMQRLMSDWRYKKKPATLYCIGLNNMDHIARIHGEEAADDVLVGISKILQKHLRSEDLIGRHEKYAFITLVQIPLERAELIARRINHLVQHTEIFSGKKRIKTTITMGAASFPEHGNTLRMLYSAAQKVLDYHRQNDIRAYAIYDPKIHDTIPSKPIRSIKSVKA